jgi:hypothetical protein
MLACGLPVAATDCLGHNEFLPTDIPIQSELISKIKTQELAQDNHWFKGDVGTWGKVEEKQIEVIKEKITPLMEQYFAIKTHYQERCLDIMLLQNFP